jgi:rifampicin phosphotransferase
MGEPDRLATLLTGAGLDATRAGGKGAALDRLIGLGAPVPPTGVVTTEAYRCFVGSAELRAVVDALRDGPLPALHDHDRARREVDQAFLGAPMPAPVAEAISELSAVVAGAGSVAVRSSATAEDLSSASFAGQYRSFLDVHPRDVERAVRLTWASLWHPAARTYRRYRRIDEDRIAMAVIVMRMLEPAQAGVVFTRDPAGSTGDLRIEFVEGLGEALVSGARTPDAVVVPRGDVAGPLPELPPAIADVARLSMQLESELGAPQDVEWATDGDQLWLLQARPITTLALDVGSDDGFDVPVPPDTTATTAGIAEMLPGLLAPRAWERNSWFLEEAFRLLFDELGGRLDGFEDAHALIRRVRGRAALDLDLMESATASVPGGSAQELHREYVGGARPGSAVAATDTTSGVAQGVRTLRARLRAAQESEIVIRAVDQVIDLLPDPRSCSDPELVALSARVLDLAARTAAAELAVAAMASASYRGVESFLGRHLTADARVAAQRVTGGTGVLRSPLALALEPLAADVRADAELTTLVAALPWDRAEVSLRSTPTGTDFLARFHATVATAGSTAIFGGPSWDEAPELAWMALQRLVERPLAGRPDEAIRRRECEAVERRLAADPQWRFTRLMSGQIVDIRRRFLRREAADAAEFLDRRERTKAAVLRLGGVARRIDLELASRLVERGALETATDIELVTDREAAQLLTGSGPGLDVIAARRRRLDTAALDGPLPHVFHGNPAPVRHSGNGTDFHGWGAAPGRYEGRACVVRSPETAELQRGDVLVARNTDASWAPLFLSAGALVVEEGGPLSHAAIVARELGMPAVVNVPGILDRLEHEVNGATLTIDGTTGVVSVHPLDAIVPTRGPVTALDRASTPSLGVFVTGLMGAGAVLSVVVALTETISSVRGRARLAARAQPIAAMVAEGVLDGFDAVAHRSTGIHSRRWHAVGAAALAALALVFGVRATLAYLGVGPRTNDSVVVWALDLVSVFTLLAAAAVLGVAARRWPSVPVFLRGSLPRRASSRPSARDVLGTRRLRFITGAMAIVATLAGLTVVADRGLLAIDHWIYDAIDAGGHADRWGPDWLNRLGHPHVVVLCAVLIAIVTFRCRPFAAAYPVAILAAGSATLALNWLTSRPRPLSGGHAGEFNSYPGGHAVQVTLLLGLLPLAVHIVTHRRWLAVVARVACTATLAVLLVDTVRTGGHWPSDQLAGFLIGAALVVAVHAIAHTPALHTGCRSCPVAPAKEDQP